MNTSIHPHLTKDPVTQFKSPAQSHPAMGWQSWDWCWPSGYGAINSQDLHCLWEPSLTHLPASLSSSQPAQNGSCQIEDIMVLLLRLGPTGAWDFCRSLHSQAWDQGPPRPSLTQHPHTGLTLPPGWPFFRASDFLSCYHIPKTWLRMAHTSCGGQQ